MDCSIMNIAGYFQQKRSHILSQEDKLAIYNKIMAKTRPQTKPSLFSRLSVFRHAVSVMFVVVLMTGSFYTFGPGVFNTIFLSQDRVQAIDVAKIIDVEWFYQIKWSDNRKVISDTIHDGDIIDVNQGSSLLLEIASHNAKILWPASFKVTYVGKKTNNTKEYRLKMIHGDYVAVESKKPSLDISNENVSVETNDGLVINETDEVLKAKKEDQKNTQEDKKTRFTLTKKANKNVVDNSGTEQVILTHAEKNVEAIFVPDRQIATINEVEKNTQALDVIVAETQQQTEVIEQLALSGTLETWGFITGVVTVNSGSQISWSLLSGAQNTGGVVISSGTIIQQLTGATTQNQSGIVLTITGSQNTLPNSGQIDSPTTWSALLSGDTNTTAQTLPSGAVNSWNTTEPLINNKTITARELQKEQKILINEDFYYAVEQQLHSPFLQKQLESITLAHSMGKAQQVTTLLNTLHVRINSLHDLMGEKNPYNVISFESTMKAIESLKQYMQQNNIDAHYIHNLTVVKEWLMVLATLPEGEFSQEEEMTRTTIQEKRNLKERISLQFH